LIKETHRGLVGWHGAAAAISPSFFIRKRSRVLSSSNGNGNLHHKPAPSSSSSSIINHQSPPPPSSLILMRSLLPFQHNSDQILESWSAGRLNPALRSKKPSISLKKEPAILLVYFCIPILLNYSTIYPLVN
jgi:hypothetical protein